MRPVVGLMGSPSGTEELQMATSVRRGMLGACAVGAALLVEAKFHQVEVCVRLIGHDRVRAWVAAPPT